MTTKAGRDAEGLSFLSSPWHLLVVDDEPDVHDITRLALKHKIWRQRAIDIRSAYSGREARDVLMKPDYRGRLQVAVIDVVMETKFAGLDLCRFIRSELPRSVRIILRTGHPGCAPEERAISDYDIDYYFTKDDATPDRLFTAVRACFRSSQDLETLLALTGQLRSFTTALQTVANHDDLVQFMRAGLHFLERKHLARIVFVPDVDEESAAAEMSGEVALVRRAHELGLEPCRMHPASSLGGANGQFVLNFGVAVNDSNEPPVRSGFVIHPGSTMHGLHSDLLLCVQNWTVAITGLFLQVRIAREKALQDRMHLERIQSLTKMVTGLAHKINTPLGVAHTANFMMRELAEELDRCPFREEIAGVLGDMRDATNLLTRNLTRAGDLMTRFRQLSVSQLSDECVATDLLAVVRETVDSLPRPNEITASVACDSTATPWVGYPGHLTQVLRNVLQNAVRHAYGSRGAGMIDVRLLNEEEAYRLEVEDYGCGIPNEILPNLFEPFAVWRGSNDAGLGLAVAKNIVTSLLRGEITCTSTVGVGSKFVIRFPRAIAPAAE